jgi:hypothetical protein
MTIFALPRFVSHGDHDCILVDIEAHVTYGLLHVLVSFVGGYS